jgi:hypothetical protein
MKTHLSILFFLLLSSANTGFSQAAEFYEDLKGKSDLVFEGKIIKSTGRWNQDHSMIFTEHEILVSKVFKGEQRGNKVILITPGGISEGQFMFGSHILDLEAGMEGIFFAQNKAFEGIRASELNANTCFANKVGSYYPKNFTESSVPLGYGALKSKYSYERFLIVLGNPIYEFDAEVETGASAFDCAEITTETLAEISFSNFQISGNFENIEFDIVIKASPEGLKLGKCEYKISFPDSIFGSFLVQNNLIEISKGDLIYGDNDFLLTITDEEANVIKVSIQHVDGYTNEAILQDEEIQLLHCKFTITNPLLLTQLVPGDFDIEGNVWYQCNGRLIPFDRLFFKTDIKDVSGFGTAGIAFHLQKFSFRTQGAFQILSLDIYAASTETKALNTAELYINYSSAAFGTFLKMNNRVSFTGPPGYLYEISDAGANVLKIELTEAFPNTPPLIIGLEPVKLATLTLIAQNCNNAANISWNNLTNNTNQTYLENGDIFIYSSISFTGGLNLPMCGCNQPDDDPEIISFSSNQIRAGVGEQLTIFGNNFGEVIVRSSCYIEVDNADHAFPNDQSSPGWANTNRTRIPLDDIIDWRNDAITFIVPSTTLGKYSAAMESGKVIVFNECGESNDENMDVEYAVANIRVSGRAYRVALEKQTENGIHFTFSSNVGTDEKILTEYAVNTWCSSTNIGWSVGGSTSSVEVLPDDNINIVVEVDPQTNPFLAGAYAGVVRAGEVDQVEYVQSCTNSEDQAVYYVRNIDVLINKNINFGNPIPPLTWARFQSIFLHELGHAHLLEHAAVVFGSGQVQKLMYYTSDVFNYNITNADRNGAVSVFGASQALLSGGESCPSPIEAFGCPNSVDDLSDRRYISIMPNPFDSEITLKSDIPLSSNTSITIYSVTGQLLYKNTFAQGEPFIVSGLGFLANGMYIVRMQSSLGDWSGKIIKM